MNVYKKKYDEIARVKTTLPHCASPYSPSLCCIAKSVNTIRQRVPWVYTIFRPLKRNPESLHSTLAIFSQKLSKNGTLLPKLFWSTVRKNCSSDREKLLRFEAEGQEFAKFLRSLEQFIQTVKGQTNFWWQNAFLTCSARFLISNKLEQLKFKLKKILGFRNMKENLEKAFANSHVTLYLKFKSFFDNL